MTYRLGLDIGVTSLGWSVLQTQNKKIIGITDMGVRIFPDGREAKSKQPLAVIRRNARSARRNLDRRLLRMKLLTDYLTLIGLFPANLNERKKIQNLNPYEMRDKASRQQVDNFELGRALYHICLRRGFKSNRKADKGNKDAGSMKTAIKKLMELIEEAQAKTLGQYLYYRYQQDDHAQLRVSANKVGLKNDYNFYPSREMYIHEVNVILEKQPQVTSDQKSKILNLIFYQRPLKPQEVGFCLLEEKEKRAPKAHPVYQLFRLLQTVNDLNYSDDVSGECMMDADRERVKEMLLNKGKVSFDSIRKKLKVLYKFSHESERRTDIYGHEINAVFSSKKAFGSDWMHFSLEEQEKIIYLLLDEEDEEKIKIYLEQTYPQLTQEQIAVILDAHLPDGYGHLSVKAMQLLIPFLEKGMNYYNACIQAGYHDKDKSGELLDILPYYGEVLYRQLLGGSFDVKDKNFPEVYYGKVNNPTVHIALNQVRCVVNALI